MTTTTTPGARGYLTRSISDSTAEVLSKVSHDRVLSITKNAIRSYIEQFWSTEDGRAVLETISPDAVNFVTDKSFEPTDDHTKKQLQIAAMMEEVKEQLPCILLIDMGCKYVSTGVSPVEYTNYVDDKLESVLRFQREIPLTLLVAAGDEETCGQLLNLCTFVFGDLRTFVGGDQLNSANPEDSWTITLPKVFEVQNMTAVNPTELQGDPRSRFWRAEISMQSGLFFEDVVKFIQQRPNVDTPEFGVLPVVTIECPSEISVNVPVTIRVINFVPGTMKLTLSDARVATINPTTKVLTARSFGSFTVRVMDKVLNAGARTDPLVDKGLPPKILAEKLVTVKP